MYTGAGPLPSGTYRGINKSARPWGNHKPDLKLVRHTTKTRVKRIEVREPPCQKFLSFVITHLNTLAPFSHKCFRRIGIRPRGWVGFQIFHYCAGNTQLSQARLFDPCCIYAVQYSTALHCSTVGIQPTFTVGRGPFPEVKRPVCGVDHPPLSSVEVKERVGSYLYSPSAPSWHFTG
jgi:hypothetical protein